MTVKTDSLIVGLDSVTDTNNFRIDTDGAGGLRIRRKSDGSGVTVLTINANGTLVQPAQSMIRVNTINGFGSTNTKIRRFLNGTNGVSGCVIQGTDITYADSATLGASFTINTAGVYAISYTDQFTTSDNFGVSLNTASGSTSFNANPVAEQLCLTTNAGSAPACASSTVYLSTGSVLRPHSSGTGPGVTAALFTITRVA